MFGPPADHDGAVAVLREVIELGITHIDTSDFYGPHVTNQIVKEALHPYPDKLHIVTKVGARRDAEGGWLDATLSPGAAPGRDARLDASVSTLLHGEPAASTDSDSPEPGSIAEPFTAVAQLQQEGLIKHLGVSTVSAEQVAEAQSIAPIVCVQNSTTSPTETTTT